MSSATPTIGGYIAPDRLGGGTADETTFLRGDQVWAAGGGTSVEVAAFSVTAGTTASTTGTTFVTHVSGTRVLSAGTWDITVIGAGSYNNATNNGGGSQKISSPVTSLTAADGVTAFGRWALFTHARGNVVSDGSTPITFTLQYNNNGTGTTVANAATLIAICRK